MRWVDLNYDFECDWLIELSVSDNKLPNNKLSDNYVKLGELVENRSFFKPITIQEIVIFMINAKFRAKIKAYFVTHDVSYKANTGFYVLSSPMVISKPAAQAYFRVVTSYRY